MNSDFINLLKMHMGSQQHLQAQPYWGIVTSYDPNTHRAKVAVQPQDADVTTPLVSGWLPICTPTMGNGWGIVAPPAINEQVYVVPDGGDSRHGVIMGSSYSLQSLPPKPGGSANIQNGEIAITQQTGSYIKFANNGDVVVTHGSGSTLTMTSDGSITIVPSGGTLKVTGNVWATGTIIAGDGTGDQVGLQTHRHGTGSAAAGTVIPTTGT